MMRIFYLIYITIYVHLILPSSSLSSSSRLLDQQELAIRKPFFISPRIQPYHAPAAHSNPHIQTSIITSRKRLSKRDPPSLPFIASNLDDDNVLVKFFYENWRQIRLFIEVAYLVIVAIAGVLITFGFAVTAFWLCTIIGSILSGLSFIIWKLGTEHQLQYLSRIYPQRYVNEFNWYEALARETGVDKVSRWLTGWPPKLVEKSEGVEMEATPSLRQNVINIDPISFPAHEENEEEMRTAPVLRQHVVNVDPVSIPPHDEMETCPAPSSTEEYEENTMDFNPRGIATHTVSSADDDEQSTRNNYEINQVEEEEDEEESVLQPHTVDFPFERIGNPDLNSPTLSSFSAKDEHMKDFYFAGPFHDDIERSSMGTEMGSIQTIEEEASSN